jgi:hypothetical protein
LLIDRDNWPHHRAWVLFVVLIAIAATAWYAVEWLAAGVLPGGSSLPGFVFGVVGGLIILFEFLLWFRKKVRVWRIGSAVSWMVAHIWLGLLCLPLLVYHSGFRLGGTLSTALMVLLVIVIVSGIWGLVLQQFLPRRMLDDIPAETIYSQIDYLTDQLAKEADQLVLAVCGPGPNATRSRPAAGTYSSNEAESPGTSHMVVGAVRSVGLVQGKVLQTRLPPAPVPDSDALRIFFHDNIVSFLREGPAGSSALRNQSRAAAIFQELKTTLPQAAHGSVDALERMCYRRRQWAQQARLHFWLHNWLWVHFPLSVALVVLMIVHAYVAVKYW